MLRQQQMVAAMALITNQFEYQEERRKKFAYIRKSIVLQQRKTMMECLEFFSRYLLEKCVISPERTLGTKARYGLWFDDFVVNFTEVEFMQNFRMDHETFMQICVEVDDDLKPKPAIMMPRIPLSTCKQVAIAIYKLASCAEMRVVGNQMGVSIRFILYYFIWVFRH